MVPNAAALVSPETDASQEDDATFAWERQLRPALDAIDGGGASRALVVGIAGSGKSRMLRHLQRVLREESGREASLLPDADADVAGLPASHVLLVDDLHLRSAAQLARLRDRAADPQAAFIATSRPWPSSPAAVTVARELERTRPAIVLGHLSRSDVLTHLAGLDQRIDDGCLDHILARTDGVAWLVSAALAAHDPRDCANDPSHGELERILSDQISHRLTMIDPGLRRGVELLCVSAPLLGPGFGSADARDELVLRAHAEGLTTRGGTPVPIVRASVRATMPAHRVVDLGAGLAAQGRAASDDDLEWIAASGDAVAGALLVEHADALLDRQPERAAELYRTALDAGIPSLALLGRRAQAAWATGDLDTAAILADEASVAAPDDRVADTAAATWAARGMMSPAAAVYRALLPQSAPSRTRAAIAALGAGDRPAVSERDEPGAPSSLGVAMRHVRDGLAASLDDHTARTALVDLVRGAELYTSSRTAAPTPELPAVVAATAAMGLGELDAARAIVDDAVSGGHGGTPARTRLLLWQAWIAVQSARPAEARDALARALGRGPAPAPRDELLARAVRIAIARRYEDAAGLAAAWAPVRTSLVRVDVDLYSLLPLTELVSSAAKVGESDRVDGAFARALALVERLGSPAMWSAHLHWAGIQQGILRNRPETLAPHAHALVVAGASSAVAQTMARAGRVWTAVLSGSVDPDAVEAAAQGLASIGLVWDAARLAGHGAGRVDDRKIAARLLACARELHPADSGRRAPAATADDGDAASASSTTEILSERELEVAHLVLQGKTYAEIGEAIFISPRTAEHHIAHIRRRLGATSRSDLLAKLRVVVGGGASGRAAEAGAGRTPVGVRDGIGGTPDAHQGTTA